MESIYNPKTFQASDNINTKEYFNKYREICNFDYAKEDIEANWIASDMGIPPEQIAKAKLEDYCSTDLLHIPDESPDAIQNVPFPITAKTKLSISYPVTDAARNLNVIRCKEIVEKRVNMDVICNKRFLKPPCVPVESGCSIAGDISPGSDFIYSIYVYRPFSINYNKKNSGEKLRFAMEIEALGTNYLSEIADIIECDSNFGLFKEVQSTKDDLEQFKDAKSFYPSQTIFVDNVFYNDFRSEKAIDYSTVLIKWAKDNNIGQFTTAEMDKVRLEELSPKFGYPYVFIHHGNCEHVISFADARLIQPKDILVKSKYPRIYSFTRPIRPRCFICTIGPSNWIVKNCERFPQEKVFLCTDCCDSYLYLDGKKIGQFNLYPYYNVVQP